MHILHPHERALLEKLSANPDYKGRNITFSALYSDELLENGDVQFPILAADVGKTAKNKSERRLALNEVFVPTRIKLGLKRVDGATGAENHAQARLWTYPNATYFVSGAATYVPEDLFALWNGFLSMRERETTYEPGIETARFLHIPEFQHGESTLNNAASPITTVRSAFDESSPENGEIFLQSSPHLRGDVFHEIKLSIPNSSNLKMKHTTANTQNFVRLIMRGFIIQGTAKSA